MKRRKFFKSLASLALCLEITSIDLVNKFKPSRQAENKLEVNPDYVSVGYVTYFMFADGTYSSEGDKLTWSDFY